MIVRCTSRRFDFLMKPITVPASIPEKSKSRKAGKPKSRKAEKPKGGNPGCRGAGKAEKPNRLRSGRSDETSCALTSNYRYATKPCGMPRHRAPRGDKNISCSLLIIFQSKLRVCRTHPSHSNGHILKRETVLMPTLWNPGTYSFGPQSRTISLSTCGRPESGLVADARLQPTSGGEAIPMKSVISLNALACGF